MTSAHPGSIHRALAANYRLDRELGGGGMSRVYVATDVALNRQVVVKVLADELSAGVSAVRFRREIQLVASLSHPHIIPLLSAGEADGALYYVMPHVTGEPLRSRMRREGPMAVADVVRILRETLDALAFAHAHGVIHRDIKPENILINAGHAVVADFGVSKAIVAATGADRPDRDSTPALSAAEEKDRSNAGLTSVGVALGTPAYMAPEQAAADPSTDHRADLYAVGVVAYEMLTGAPPFAGTNAQVMRAHIADSPTRLDQRRSDVPAALATLVMQALAKEPSERPQTASQMMAALDALVTPGASTPMPLASSPSGGSRRRRFASRKSMLLLGGVTAAALGLGATWFVTRPPMLPGAQSLAVTPFAVPDGDTALVRLGQNLVTTISANLDGVGEIRVADPAAVLSHAKARGPLISVQNAVDIARRLGARSAFYGTLTRTGDIVRAAAALYEIGDPGKPVVRVTAEAPADSIAALSDSLTWRFLREVWLSGRAPTAYASSIDTRSSFALREFLQGERMFAQQEQEAASEHYVRAIEADTTFWFAHYRYWVARSWYNRSMDTVIVNRLRRHVDEIKVPERLLIRVEMSKSVSDRLRQLREIIGRYPTFTAAKAALADRLTHHGPLIGYGPRDAIDMWTQVAAMMPTDFNAPQHILDLCLMAGDLPCVRTEAARFDTLFKIDPKTANVGNRASRDVAKFVLADSGQRLVESMVDSYAAESVYAVSPAFYPSSWARLLVLRPNLAADFNRLAEAVTKRGSSSVDPGTAEILSSELAFLRGDVAQHDSVLRRLERAPQPLREVLSRSADRTTLLLELQALRPPSPATGKASLGRITSDRAASPRLVAEARWIVAVNALLRDDSAEMFTQLAALQADSAPEFRIAARSVRALHAGLSGNTAAAAESLLVLERAHGDSIQRVWVAFAADRLLGSKWLTEIGRYAEADSLLRFTQAVVNDDPFFVANAIVGPALLQRARIAEGLGERKRAVELAQSFLLAYDLASPAAKQWVDDAHDIIRRRGGPTDLPRTRETPVRSPRR